MTDARHLEPVEPGIYRLSNNGRYKVVYRDTTNRQRTKTLDRLSDARAFLATTKADMVRGEWQDPRSGRITFAEYAARWEPAQQWRESTRQQVASHLRAHLIPTFGARRMSEITRTEIQSFVTGLALAPATVEAIYRRLVSILEAAVLDGVMAKSPAVRIRLPKATPKPIDQVVTVTLEDAHALAEAAPERLSAFIWVMTLAGLRPGEAAGLCVESVDFLRREITVDRQLVTLVGELPKLTDPKTAASVRVVPIPEALVLILSEHIAEHGTIDTLDQNGDPARLLFASRDGRPLRRTTMSDNWHRISKSAQVEASGWHQLRHLYASLLIQAGQSVRAVQSRLGHASAVETLETYAALWPDSDDETRQALQDAFPSLAVSG